MNKNKHQESIKVEVKKVEAKKGEPMLPQRLITLLADEVAETLVRRLPHLISRPQKKSKNQVKIKKIENGVFLDTSAIIDGRMLDVIKLGLINNLIVIPESVLLELKRVADSQDMVKRERGRKGLEMLEGLRKTKNVKFIIFSENQLKGLEKKEVDERLIYIAKANKGRIITCDYNLEKKASIQGVMVVNVNELSNALKIRAVPGESLHIKIQHLGKDATQGVGYLDDGTMIVVESGNSDLGELINVVVSRVIQTSSGRILFAKKI
ncbi:MAG: PIN domain-containing protein [Patescibacteria group bacterium]